MDEITNLGYSQTTIVVLTGRNSLEVMPCLSSLLSPFMWVFPVNWMFWMAPILWPLPPVIGELDLLWIYTSLLYWVLKTRVVQPLVFSEWILIIAPHLIAKSMSWYVIVESACGDWYVLCLCAVSNIHTWRDTFPSIGVMSQFILFLKTLPQSNKSVQSLFEVCSSS